MNLHHTTPRIEFKDGNPKLYPLMMQLSQYLSESRLDPVLQELVKIRASQMNACAFCLDMHCRRARELGVDESRIYMLSAWREASVYSDAERVALELTEVITDLGHKRLSLDLVARVREHFPTELYIDLLATINVINAWNRFMVGMGHTQPPRL